MKLHLTPLSLSPTIQGFPLVVYYASKVKILDAPRGFLRSLCYNIAQATLILRYNYFKTVTISHFLHFLFLHTIMNP